MTGLIKTADANKPAPIPSWMELTAEAVTITLSVPSEINGVKVDKIRLRSPSLSDVNKCQAAHPGDGKAVDLMLFASLADTGTKDVEGLKLKDYYRVQAGYFRLVEEDED